MILTSLISPRLSQAHISSIFLCKIPQMPSNSATKRRVAVRNWSPPSAHSRCMKQVLFVCSESVHFFLDDLLPESPKKNKVKKYEEIEVESSAKITLGILVLDFGGIGSKLATDHKSYQLRLKLQSN